MTENIFDFNHSLVKNYNPIETSVFEFTLYHSLGDTWMNKFLFSTYHIWKYCLK